MGRFGYLLKALFDKARPIPDGVSHTPAMNEIEPL